MDKVQVSRSGRKRNLVNTEPQKSQETGERREIPQRKMKRAISSGDNPEKPCHALELFPLEIWEKILEYLKEPKDILNCAWVCTTFRADLQKRICDIMFFQAFLTFLQEGRLMLPLTERLNLRLVCKDLAKLVIDTDDDLDRIIYLKTQTDKECVVLQLLEKTISLTVKI